MPSRYFRNLEQIIADLSPEEVASLRIEPAEINAHPPAWRLVAAGVDGPFSIALPDTRLHRDTVREAAEQQRLEPPDIPDDLFIDEVGTEIVVGEIRARAGLNLVVTNPVAFSFFSPLAQELGGRLDPDLKTITFTADAIDGWKDIVVQTHEFERATTLPPDMNTVAVRSELSQLGGRWDSAKQLWHFHDPYRIKDRDTALRATEHALLDHLYPVSTLAHIRGEEAKPALYERKEYLRWGLMLAYGNKVPVEVLERDPATDARWLDSYGLIEAGRCLNAATKWCRENRINLTAEIKDVVSLQREMDKDALDANRKSIEDRVADRRAADRAQIAGQPIEDTRDSHDVTERVVTENGVVERQTSAAWGPYGEVEADRRNALSQAHTAEERDLANERYWLANRARESLDAEGHSKSEVKLDAENGHYVGNLVAHSKNFVAMRLQNDGRGGFVVLPIDDFAWEDFREKYYIRKKWSDERDPDTKQPIQLTVGYTYGTADIHKGNVTLDWLRNKNRRDVVAEQQRAAVVAEAQAELAQDGAPNAAVEINKRNGLYVGPIIRATEKLLVQRVADGIVVHTFANTGPKAANVMKGWQGNVASIGYTDGSFDGMPGEQTLEDIRAKYNRIPKELPVKKSSRSTPTVDAALAVADSVYQKDHDECQDQARQAICKERGVPKDQVYELEPSDGAFGGTCLARTKYHIAQKSVGAHFRTYELISFENPENIPQVGQYFQTVVESGYLKQIDVHTPEQLGKLNALRALEGKNLIDEDEFLRGDPSFERADKELRAAFMKTLEGVWKKTNGRRFDEELKLRETHTVRGQIVYFDDHYVATNLFRNGKFDNTCAVVHPREFRTQVTSQLENGTEYSREVIAQPGLDRTFSEKDIGADIKVVYRTTPGNGWHGTIVDFTPVSRDHLGHRIDLESEETIHDRIRRSHDRLAGRETDDTEHGDQAASIAGGR